MSDTIINKVNVYDFDNTIFSGDSTARFLTFLLKKRPALLRYVPVWGVAGLGYAVHATDKTSMKRRIYSVFAAVPDTMELVGEFWRENKDRVKEFYRINQRPDDIIISASPEFLLKDFCGNLGVGLLIASRVDPTTGAYDGENCHGEEKVRRLRELRPDVEIGEFYSDSYSDQPLALLAERAFMVRGDELKPWEFRK